VANFTQVTRTAAVAQETCYKLPGDAGTKDKLRQATLHNTDVTKHNDTLPSTYIESAYFDPDGIKPVLVALRDASNHTYYIDVSNRGQVSVVDTERNAMLIDAQGIHFSTRGCAYDVSITIKDMFQQLEGLSGSLCSKLISKRVEESSFEQILYLKDQCGNAVQRTLRKYPTLRIGDSDCIDTEIDSATGKWTFTCPFPGVDSDSSRCRAAVRKDIVRFLLRDPFGGACPDLSTVVTTLEATARDLLSAASLKEALYTLGLNRTQREEVDGTVSKYMQLWDIFKHALSKGRGHSPSAMERYFVTYGKYRSLDGDICNDLHDGDPPFNMSLEAGVTTISSLTALRTAPEMPRPFNVTIQDSAQVACCRNGSKASSHAFSGTCSYPANATIGTSGCVCGTTASGQSAAFEYMECGNFASNCRSDSDCAIAGYDGFKCLVGSCCGGGVCFDPFACSQKGVELVEGIDPVG
jgi:hypothetical protein